MSKRLLVWCFNIVVAVLCVLSIACYFIAPIWDVGITISVTPETIEKIAPEDTIKDGQFEFPLDDESEPIVIPLTDIVPEEGETISVSLNIGSFDLIHSVSYKEKDTVMEELLDRNVNGIIDQLSGHFGDLTQKVVQTVAKQTVKREVKSNVKQFLIDHGESDDITDEEVEEKLLELGFTDEYMDEKMNDIVDSFYTPGADVDSVTGQIMSTIDEVYETFRENASGKEGYEEFENFEMSAEDREELEANIREKLEDMIADGNGNINPDDFLNRLLLDALKKNESETDGNETAPTSYSPLAPLADDTQGTDAPQQPADTDVKAELVNTIRGMIMEQLPGNIYEIMSFASIGLTVLAALSMLPWVYVLIKLFVKLLTHGIPTVKLALPIWLGWLFFLLLVGLPNLAIMLIPTLNAKFGFLSADFMELYNSLSISVGSITWITAVSALVCFAISIFYMVMRRKIKREEGIGKHKKKVRDDG